MEEFGNDFITLIDDDGNEVEMEHLDTLEQDGVVYMAFAVADEGVEDAADLVILQVEAEEGSDHTCPTFWQSRATVVDTTHR